MVSNINKQNIYQPYLKPLVNQVSTKWNETWDEYGEWVHGALDLAGFIPGLGEIADGVNGLIYLAEGRYLEASLSAMSMIPLQVIWLKPANGPQRLEPRYWKRRLKNYLKNGMGLAEQVAKEAVEEVGEKLLKKAGEELAEKMAAGIARNENLYVPLVDNITEPKLGEWVHDALDMAGVVPGFVSLRAALTA